MTNNELSHRVNNAIILLTEGHTLKIGDLTFDAKDEHHFSVTGWTLCNDIKNLTKQSALDEINETKTLFNKMISVSPKLTNFIKDRQIKYSLGYDYGMGGIEICNETNGQIKWTIELE